MKWIVIKETIFVQTVVLLSFSKLRTRKYNFFSQCAYCGLFQRVLFTVLRYNIIAFVWFFGCFISIYQIYQIYVILS